MKFFTRRQMRSIHYGMLERKQRAQRMQLASPNQPVAGVLATNLDRLVVVGSFGTPPLKPGLLDRMLVLAEQERLEGLVVLNKVDLLKDRSEAVRLQRLYSGLGYPTLLTSAHTGEGTEELRARLSQGRSALSGHSGVGKSSLFGALEPGLAPSTGEVSLATGKGRHTTTTVRLFRLSGGGELFDLPGLKLAPIAAEPAELSRRFPDFAACPCRYRDCLHQGEPGCAVVEAVEQGLVDRGRFESYQRILASL